jgi:TonB family protein
MSAWVVLHPVTLAAQSGGNTDSGQESVPVAPQYPVKPQPGVQILSDTMGVDFGPYLKRMMSEIKRNSEPLIPATVKAPEMKKGVVGVRFTILPDGKIGTMKLETRSGDVDLDKAAWYAITSEGNFPPLPAEFHGPLIDLRVGFFYNMKPGY